MEHVAIMDKKFGFIPKILDGQKSIESRWYMHKSCPWDQIHNGDMIYFKNSGEAVCAKAVVSKVMQFTDLKPEKIDNLLQRFGHSIGLTSNQIPTFEARICKKKYAILIFLEKPEKISTFNINKTGFGAMSAWISIEDINRIIC